MSQTARPRGISVFKVASTHQALIHKIHPSLILPSSFRQRVQQEIIVRHVAPLLVLPNVFRVAQDTS